MDENTSKANKAIKIGPATTVMSTAEMVDFLMELARGERSFYTVGTREGLMSVAIHLRTISNVLFRKMGNGKPEATEPKMEDGKPKAVEEKPKAVEASTLPTTKEETSEPNVVETIFRAMNEDGKKDMS